MGKKSFTWNPKGVCVFGSLTKPQSSCFFDYWSIYHFYFTGFFYILLHHYLNISSIKGVILLFMILTVIHVAEEVLGNTTRISGEGIFFDYIAPLIDPKIDPKMRKIDDDYIENSIGDVLSGVISTILIIGYWMKYKKLPYFYLYGLIIVFFMLSMLRSGLYSKT